MPYSPTFGVEVLIGGGRGRFFFDAPPLHRRWFLGEDFV